MLLLFALLSLAWQPRPSWKQDGCSSSEYHMLKHHIPSLAKDPLLLVPQNPLSRLLLRAPCPEQHHHMFRPRSPAANGSPACGPWTSSHSVTWTLARNVPFQPHARIRKSESEFTGLFSTSLPGDGRWCSSNLRATDLDPPRVTCWLRKVLPVAETLGHHISEQNRVPLAAKGEKGPRGSQPREEDALVLVPSLLRAQKSKDRPCSSCPLIPLKLF